MKVTERVEARQVALRLLELFEAPAVGRFDREHLLEVHRRIFQDFPDYLPGQLHGFGRVHKKHRILTTINADYPLIYAKQRELNERLDSVLARLDGGNTVVGLTEGQLVGFLNDIYGDLDYLHPFTEGNSRTLREFTREIALHAGFELDWTPHGLSQQTQERLYYARDREVFKRAVGDIPEEKARMGRVHGDFDLLNAWTRYQIMVDNMAPGDTLASLIQEAIDAGNPDRKMTESKNSGAKLVP